MKEYEIKFEPVIINEIEYPKYNIYYYINNVLENKEFHSTDGISGIVRIGYNLKTNQ